MKRNISSHILLAFMMAAMLALGYGCKNEAAVEEKAQAPAPEQSKPDAQESGVEPHAEAVTQVPEQPVDAEPAIFRDIVTRPMEKELGRDALETYAYLLFIQAILDEDEAAILEAAPHLEKSGAPAGVWLDGGVWLMSRKSPNSIVFLEQALKALPDDLSMNLLYAEALGEHGMADRGVDVMRGYLKRHPEALDARLELALLLVKAQQFEEAQKILSAISPKQRTSLVDYYQARALIGMDKKQDAIPYLRKAIREMPDFVDAMAELAFLYEQQGNLREARSIYGKLQKLHFSPQEVGLRLINLSLKLKQPEQALKYLKQGPDTLTFKLTAANMLLESRHYLQAESILKGIAGQHNAPPEVYLLLADLVYEQRHNLNMALSWLDRIPADKPGAERAMLLRIQLLAEAGKMEQALTTAETAATEYPALPEVAELRIRLLAREKKFADALVVARKAVEQWPDNTGLEFLLGSVLDENGEKKEALQVMEDIIRKQPDHYQALNYVGFTLAEENRDLQRALELLQKADALSPNQAYIVDSLAWALFRAGQGDEALRQIRRAIELGDNQDAAIWEHYGDIAVRQGKKDEARRAYRRAIELKPANVGNIRERLSRL